MSQYIFLQLRLVCHLCPFLTQTDLAMVAISGHRQICVKLLNPVPHHWHWCSQACVLLLGVVGSRSDSQQDVSKNTYLLVGCPIAYVSSAICSSEERKGALWCRGNGIRFGIKKVPPYPSLLTYWWWWRLPEPLLQVPHSCPEVHNGCLAFIP